jgi:phage-related protein
LTYYNLIDIIFLVSIDILAYCNEDGESPIIEFLDGLSVKERAKCFAYLSLLAEYGNRLTSQFIKHIEGGLWELRPELGGVEMRLFYFIWTDTALVVVHGLKKKSRKARRRDIDLALRRIEEIENAQAHIIEIIS